MDGALAAALLCAAIAVEYRGAVDAPFIYDDALSVGANKSIVRLWPLVGSDDAPGPLRPPHALPTSGRPLVNFSLAVNYWFGGLDPRGYRLFNLAVHALSALVLLAIVRRVLRLEFFEGRFERAALAVASAVALVWAVHPLASEAVIYVTQRTELLVGLFYLLTIYCSLRYWAAASRGARAAWVALAAAACLCGMACKEVMVTAPAVVLLMERTFVAGTFRRALRSSWPLYAALALGWAFLWWLNRGAPRSDSAGFHLGVSAAAWWLTQAKALWLYLKLAVWPAPLVIHYGLPFLTPEQAWPWALGAAALGAGTAILLWRRRAAGLVGAWVLVILSPTLVVPIVTEVAAERRMYLPLAGIVALVVVGGYWLGSRAREKRLAVGKARGASRWLVAAEVAAAGAVAIAFVALGARRAAEYRDEATLWRGAADRYPNDVVSQNNLAFVLLRSGKNDEAAERVERAWQSTPTMARRM